MVVVAHLPKSEAALFSECKGRALFEQANKLAQVAPVMDTFRKNAYMVRHQAKRMQTKRKVSGTFQQGRKNAPGGDLFTEVLEALVAADRNEISLPPQVIVVWQAADLAMDGHIAVLAVAVPVFVVACL